MQLWKRERIVPLSFTCNFVVPVRAVRYSSVGSDVPFESRGTAINPRVRLHSYLPHHCITVLTKHNTLSIQLTSSRVHVHLP